MSDIIEIISKAIIDGNSQSVRDQVQEALDSGLNPDSILTDGMISAMAEVGRLFEEGQYYVPEMLVAARAMKEGLAVLRPYLSDDSASKTGTVIIGTVKGDLHDIGKNLVAMMMEGAGFEINDLGTDVAPERFIDAIKSNLAESRQPIIAMSALLTTTMTNMQTIINGLIESGVRDKVKVMIGGAPVTEKYAEQIGADGYAPDASRAVTIAKQLIQV
jgi:5-methyltetrahydrofolate--homocysteine methyltransferase